MVLLQASLGFCRKMYTIILFFVLFNNIDKLPIGEERKAILKAQLLWSQ